MMFPDSEQAAALVQYIRCTASSLWQVGKPASEDADMPGYPELG
jgi:hypothetical protein